MTEARRQRWEHLFGAPARRPWLTLVITGVLLMLSVAGLLRMRPNATLAAVFGKHDPATSALGKVLSDFPAADEVLLLVTDDDAAASAEASAARLAQFGARFDLALRAAPGNTELVSHIFWRADQGFIDYFTQVIAPAGVYYLNDLSPLLERLRPEEMKEQIKRNEAMIAAPGLGAGALAKQLLKDPLRFRDLVDQSMRDSLASPIKTYGGGREFISTNGKSLLVRVGGRRPVSDLGHARAITELVKKMAERPDVNADRLQVEYSGAYAIAAASERAMRSDMTGNIWGSIVAFQLLFLVAYRGLLSFVLAFIPVLIGNVAAFGAFSLHSTDITPIVAVIGSLLAGLGIEYTVHFLTQYEALRVQGLEPAQACERTGADLMAPVLVGCGTSIVGFMSVVLSNVVSVRAFAILGSLGLALTVLATFALMPAMMVLIERHWPRLVRAKGQRFGAEWLIRVAAARPRMWIGVSGVLIAAGIAVLAANPDGLRFETDLSVMHARPNAPLEVQNKLAERFGDVAESLIVHIEAGSADELVSRAHRVQDRLETPMVRDAGATRAIGLANLLPDPSKRVARESVLASIDPAAAEAGFQAAIADSLFNVDAYKDFIQTLPKLLHPAEYPTIATLRRFPSVAESVLPRDDKGGWQAVTLVMIDRPLNDARSRDAALDALDAAVRDVPGATATGLGAVSRAVEQTVQHDMPYQVAAAAIIVALCNFLFLRRVGLTLLSYTPVLCAVLAIVVYMTLTGERINLANVVAIPLIFGLGIDFGLFTIQVARQCEREKTPGAALVARLGHSSHAFFINTLTTILGFGTLVFTSTPALQSLGRLMGVAVCACMLATSFLVVPALVLKMQRR